MTHVIGGALASVFAQIDIPPEIVNLGAVGIVAFAAAVIALALWGLVRTGAPLLKLLSSQFSAMQASNDALLKRIEASDDVIERNTKAHTANAAALDRVATDTQQRSTAILTDVAALSKTVERQLADLREHITATSEENKDAIIEVIGAALPILEEIRQQAKDAAALAIEQNAAVINRVAQTEEVIITALSKWTPPIRQTAEIAAVAKRIETGKLPPVTELLNPAE